MPRGSGSVPLPAPGLPDAPASVCPQPAASAALYAQLVRGQKGLEAVETLGRLLAHIEQSLARRGTAYLAGVSGTTGRGQPCSQKGVGPSPCRSELAAACPEAEPWAWVGAASRPDSASLAQDTKSVADVVVWGALFPVLRDETSLPSKSEIGVPR